MGPRRFAVLLFVAAALVAAGYFASTASAATPGTRLWTRGIPQVVTPQGDEVLWIKPAPKGTFYLGGVYDEPIASGWLFVARYSAKGRQLWVRKYGQAQHIDANGEDMTVDRFGNLIVAGVAVRSNDSRLLVLKYSPKGKLLWHKEWNGPVAGGLDAANAVACDRKGNVIAGGTTTQPGTGEDYLVVKYNAAGHRKWAYHTAGQGTSPNDADVVWSLGADGAGNVYLTGGLRDASGNASCVTQKLSPIGKLRWSHAVTGIAPGDSVGDKLVVSGGKIRVAASVYDGASSDDVDLIIYGLDGSSGGGTTNDFGNAQDNPDGLAVTANGATWVCGWSDTTSTTSTAFVIRYDANGIETGEIAYLPTGVDSTLFNGIAIDARGSAWAVGDAFAASEGRLVVVKLSGPKVTQGWQAFFAGTRHGASGTCVMFDARARAVVVGGWTAATALFDPLVVAYAR